MMNIVVLDAKTLGADISLAPFDALGTCTVYPGTAPEEIEVRISDCDVVVLNKIKLHEENLKNAKNLKLICVTATGYDNIDVAYCKKRNIGVCNVEGYSTHSVAQVTAAMVLSLSVHLPAYHRFVSEGAYTKSGVANRLEPVFHELYGKTWGIVGFGNIGRQVAKIAEAFGCRVLVCKQTPIEEYPCVDIDTLCKEADVITLHTPLTEKTRYLINKERLKMMKNTALLVNGARGAVTDEGAVCEAVKKGEIGGFGTDVFSKEPMEKDHPFQEIKDFPNVCLTPHMAWGAYEARQRCVAEIVENIKAFLKGENRNRVDR